MEARFDAADTRFDAADAVVKARIDTMHERTEKARPGLDATLQRSLRNQTRWFMATQVALIVTVIFRLG